MASAVSTGVSKPGGVDALTVQDAKINKAIRTFDDAYVLSSFLALFLPFQADTT